MKNCLFYLLIIGFVLTLIQCKSLEKPDQGKETKAALPLIENEIYTDLDNLYAASNAFKNVIQKNKHQDTITTEEIQAYLDLRKAFKTIEFVIEYWDKQFYDQKANGAPLPKLTPKDTSITIIEPKGLQVIDELMYGEINSENHQAILAHATQLEKDLQDFDKTFKNTIINQRQVFEALRYNIIRQATLSITGFDTPGSLLGITDAKAQTLSYKKYLGYFKEELLASGQSDLHQQLLTLTTEATQFIENNPDFEKFDRLTYIQQYINPMYEMVKAIHYNLGYETWDELDQKIIHTLNYDANNLFSPDFLDPFAYVSQEEDDLYKARAALGKILFYDPLLSSNNKMACASCHHPEKAFTDGLPKSIGIDGQGTLTRNSMSLPYSVYAKKMFWDIRVSGLENQFEHVVTNEQEFHTSYNEIVHKLKQSPQYVAAFEKAFPNAYAAPLSINSIDYALSAYVMTLGKFNTKLDHFMRREGNLSDSEKNGFNLFAGKAACATCHFMPTFSGLVPPFYTETESEVLGVTTTDKVPWILDEDLGRFAGLIKENADFYKHSFKTVTVRNAEKTAPYMHNGSIQTLERLMEFYNDGGGAGRGLDVPFQTLSPDPLDLQPTEISDLVAFMKTLTDLDESKPPKNNELPRDFKNSAWNQRQIPLTQ